MQRTKHDALDAGEAIAYVGDGVERIAGAHPQSVARAAPPATPALAARARADHNPGMDEPTRTEIEAAVFRRLVEHFRQRTDVKNIDVMETAGFCRNCLSKWYRAEAADRGVALEDGEARELIYGMPYDAWKAKHQ